MCGGGPSEASSQRKAERERKRITAEKDTARLKAEKETILNKVAMAEKTKRARQNQSVFRFNPLVNADESTPYEQILLARKE